MIKRADAGGMPLASPRDPAQRGGSVMLEMPAQATGIVDALRDHRIHVDMRGQILRVSPGSVTHLDHVHRLFDALETLI